MEAGLGSTVGVLQYRHIAIAIAISRQHTHKAFNDGNNNNNDNDDDDAADLQAGHSSKVGNMLYGRSVMEMRSAVTSVARAYRDVSLSWHAFLQFGEHRPSPAENGQRRRLREADVNGAARAMLSDSARLLGDGARLRGGQEEALRAIMHGESPVVAVMATGGGKSLPFMLPAWAEPDGLTVCW